MENRIMVLTFLGAILAWTSTTSATDRLVPGTSSTIQGAIGSANNGDRVIVSPGVYKGTGNRDLYFSGKTLTVRSTDPNDPDVVAATIIDCNSVPPENHVGFNLWSVDANSTIAGFTITNGAIGIMCNQQSSPRIANCTITNCIVYALNGGGIRCADSSNPVIINCTISNNRAIEDLYGNGGGIACEWSNPAIINCTISGNTAAGNGGGIYLKSSFPEITNCRIIGNTAGVSETPAGLGGGIYCTSSWPVYRNCVISGNAAKKRGGGLYGTTIRLVNCTVVGNSAGSEYPGGGVYGTPSGSYIINSIVWGNSEPQIADEETVIETTYSDVQGGYEGAGNINLDPLFADSNNSDYHLKSQTGRWNPGSQGWVLDTVTSPCIDAGNITDPIGYEPFPNGGIINMGAYGGTAEASKSYFGGPPCQTIVAGDINGDCRINFLDFNVLAAHWLEDNNP